MASKVSAVTKIDGVDKVLLALQRKSLKGKKMLRLEVGYEAPYAIYVHENLQAYHRVGRAKYLEKPARMLSKQMGEIVERSIRGKNGLEEGLIRAGNLLMDASRPQVPVDTGRLQNSGFVKVVESK